MSASLSLLEFSLCYCPQPGTTTSGWKVGCCQPSPCLQNPPSQQNKPLILAYTVTGISKTSLMYENYTLLHLKSFNMEYIHEAMYIFINHNVVADNYSYMMVAHKQLYSACIHLIFAQLKH